MKATTPIRLAVLVALAAPLARLAADVQDDWNLYCASCHGKDGAAKTRMARLSGAKDLTNPAYQQTFTDDRMLKDLREGLVVDGKTKMKPYADQLEDGRLKALVTYIRSLAK
jgi:cytochrome c553